MPQFLTRRLWGEIRADRVGEAADPHLPFFRGGSNFKPPGRNASPCARNRLLGEPGLSSPGGLTASRGEGGQLGLFSAVRRAQLRQLASITGSASPHVSNKRGGQSRWTCNSAVGVGPSLCVARRRRSRRATISPRGPPPGRNEPWTNIRGRRLLIGHSLLPDPEDELLTAEDLAGRGGGTFQRPRGWKAGLWPESSSTRAGFRR